MDKKLQDLIIKRTDQAYEEEVLQSFESMLCPDSLVPLDAKVLYETLNKEGEFLLVHAKYDEINFKDKAFDMKFYEALDIIVCFEDDGSMFEQIESFIKEAYKRTTSWQKFLFGIKKVESLSEYPVKILFGDIHPINQLELHLGTWVHKFINSDDDYFQPHFQEIREALSSEIGLPILPLYTQEDKNLYENEVKLIDSVTKETIVKFLVEENEDKKALDLYLLKLYYVFLKLGLKYKY